MPKIVPSNFRACPGGNHILVDISTNDGPPRTMHIDRDQLMIENQEELDTAIVYRFRSACKEAGATTNAQRRQALEGKEFRV